MQLPGWRIAAVYKNSDLHLRFEGDSDPGGVHFFPYQYDLIDMVAEQELLRRNGGYELRIPLAGKQAETEITGVLVSENGWRGVGSERALQVAVQAGDAPSEAEGVGLGLVTALLFAFIGGVILNLMPCVLPVLSLKVMGFARTGAWRQADIPAAWSGLRIWCTYFVLVCWPGYSLFCGNQGRKSAGVFSFRSRFSSSLCSFSFFSLP
jgi:hypothetical protein